MSAPPTPVAGTALPRTSSRVTRIRSVAHRFAGAAARALDDIVAVGVRFDDDDPAFGESLAVRLRPGRIDPLAPIAGPAKAIAHERGGGVVVVDGRGVLSRLGAETLLEGVSDLCDDGKRLLALQGDDVVDVASRATVARVKGAVSIRGGLVRAATAVYDLDGNKVAEGAADAVFANNGAGGDDVAIARGKTVTINGKSVALPFPVQTLVKACGTWFAASRQGGLVVLDDDGKSFRTLRPSLRAHQLTAVGAGLLVVSDLFVATSDDGVDFVSRDLAPYVRLAEKQTA